MNRRQFINYSGASLALLGGAYLFNSLLQLKTPDRENVDNQIKGLEEDLLDIIYLASLAPSGHNTQPWTVRIIDSHHWTIGTDLTRCLAVVDPENREALLSIGAFLENLVIAARAKGYDVDVEVVAKQPKDRDVLDIRLYKVNGSSNFDVKKIRLRRTVRNNLLNDQLSREDLQFLIGKNTDFIYYARESKEGHYLAEGTLLANKSQVDRDTAQEELANWIRWSNHDSRHYRNGLTPETMEIEGIAKWYVKNFYSRQSVLEKRFREETIKKVGEQVAAGSGWLLITSKDSSIPELIDTGRKFQRIWLEARDKRIAIHPMTQMLEEEIIGNEMASFLGITEKIQFLLRIGYCNDYPQPVSPRMLLANIIL